MSEREAPQHPRRVSSGIPSLDQLLDGGLFRGDLYVVVGPPGAGKTILGNQACFAHAATGGRAAFVTLLAETHAHMLAHLHALAFFDPAPIGASLLYYGGYQAIESDGLDGLLAFLRGVMRDDKVTLLVLDGLFTANEAAASQLAFRTFLINLQAYGEAVGCTTLLLTQPLEGGVRDPSLTIVDGVIELGTTRRGPRVAREMEVHKFRGGSYLRGQHVFAISDAGITVHPRIETALGPPALEVGGHRPRVSTGLPPLDAMLHGGLLSGSTTMLLAPPGSGKTLLGLHVLDAGAQAGEPGLHFGFYETPPLLVETAAAIGLDLGRQIADGHLTVLWQPPLEESEDALAERLLATVEERGVRRLFIDGLDGFLQAAVYPERMGRFFTALTLALRARGVTTLISVELPTLFGTTAEIPLPGVSAIAENIIVLRAIEQRSQLHRLLSIVKTRGSGHDPAIRAFTIGATGLELADTSVSAEEILGGTIPPAAPPDDRAGELGRIAGVLTIMVVEDERAIADLLSIILADAGYRVVVARNGREGLARVADNRPDVILSDIMMPVLDGIGLARALHDDPAYRAIPLVLMSAVALPPTARAGPYAAFLRKPFALDDVLDTIARVLVSVEPAP